MKDKKIHEAIPTTIIIHLVKTSPISHHDALITMSTTETYAIWIQSINHHHPNKRPNIFTLAKKNM